MTSSSVSVPVFADSEVEPNEQFDLTLTIPTSLRGITVGSIARATGIIIDSTGKLMYMYSTYMKMMCTTDTWYNISIQLL